MPRKKKGVLFQGYVGGDGGSEAGTGFATLAAYNEIRVCLGGTSINLDLQARVVDGREQVHIGLGDPPSMLAVIMQEKDGGHSLVVNWNGKHVHKMLRRSVELK